MMRLAVDLHTHTVASTGGELTEPELIAAAAAAGVDVLGITEHDRTGDRTPPRAAAPNSWRTRPLVVRGRERISGAGHQVLLDDGPAIIAHPRAPYPGGSTLRPPAAGELLEVWNGPWRSDRPWQADNEAALTWWAELLAATGPDDGPPPMIIGNSDTHLAGQIGTPCTLVEVAEPTVRAVFAAVSGGRSWVVARTHLTVDLTVRRAGATAGPGQLLSGRGPVGAAVSATGTGRALVTVLDRDGVVATGRLEHDDTLAWTVEPAGLLRVEIRDDAGDMLAISNPVRILGAEHRR